MPRSAVFRAVLGGLDLTVIVVFRFEKRRLLLRPAAASSRRRYRSLTLCALPKTPPRDADIVEALW